MYDIVCNYPLPSDLFAQAIHPSEPVVSVGLASGHVRTIRLPSATDDSPQPVAPKATNGSSNHSALRRSSTSSNGCSTIETQWQTCRHKGSCRALAFSVDGKQLISAGTDGLVKVASAETGSVQAKSLVPIDLSTGVDQPTTLCTISPDTLLLGTEAAALHVYDLRAPSTRPAQTHHRVHDDYISSLTPIASTKAGSFPRQFISTGANTLAAVDIRRGVLKRSEEQEEELLCSTSLAAYSAAEQRMLVGAASGKLYSFKRPDWRDRTEMAGTLRAEDVEAICQIPMDRVGDVALGLGDGAITFLRVGVRKGVQELGACRHDDFESVVSIDFDREGRMVSGGGSVVKVWEEALRVGEDESETDDEEEEQEDEDDDDKSDGKAVAATPTSKRRRGTMVLGSSDVDEEEEDEDSDEKMGKKKRKKRKRNKGKERGQEQHAVKIQGFE